MTGEDMLYHSGTIVMGHEAAGSSDSDGCDRPELFFFFLSLFSLSPVFLSGVRGEGGRGILWTLCVLKVTGCSYRHRVRAAWNEKGVAGTCRRWLTHGCHAMMLLLLPSSGGSRSG